MLKSCVKLSQNLIEGRNFYRSFCTLLCGKVMFMSTFFCEEKYYV